MFKSFKSVCLAAGIAAMSTTGASASLLDFTVGTPGASSGSLANSTIGWELTAIGGALSTNQAYDGGNAFKTETGSFLALDNDGVGVGNDEVTYKAGGLSQELRLSFTKTIFLQAVHFLDLFIGTNTESAITYDADTNTLLVETFAAGGSAGYAKKTLDDIAVKNIRFVPGKGNDDGSGDFALAAIDYRSTDGNTPDTVPLPAGVLLLMGALGGLAAVGRRKKA